MMVDACIKTIDSNIYSMYVEKSEVLLCEILFDEVDGFSLPYSKN